MNTKVGVAALCALAMVFAGLYYFGFVVNPTEPQVSRPSQSEPRVVMDGVFVEARDAGEKTWSIEAERMLTHEWARRTELVGVKSGAIFRSGAPYLTFQSDRGVLSSDGKDIILSGNVTVWSEGEVLLETETIRWRAGENRVSIPSPVEINIDGGRVRASRLEVDISEEKLYATGDVTVSKPGQIEVKSDTLVYVMGTKTVEIEGPFVVELSLDD